MDGRIQPAKKTKLMAPIHTQLNDSSGTNGRVQGIVQTVENGNSAESKDLEKQRAYKREYMRKYRATKKIEAANMKNPEIAPKPPGASISTVASMGISTVTNNAKLNSPLPITPLQNTPGKEQDER